MEAFEKQQDAEADADAKKAEAEHIGHDTKSLTGCSCFLVPKGNGWLYWASGKNLISENLVETINLGGYMGSAGYFGPPAGIREEYGPALFRTILRA